MSFDEQPDGDIRGECAAEIQELISMLTWAYSKLHTVFYLKQEDAKKLREIKRYLGHEE